MNKLSINFGTSKYGDLALVGFSDGVIQKMTDNPYFLTPDPTLAAVSASKKQFEEAIAKVAQGSKADTEIKNRYRKSHEQLLKKLATYVEDIAQGDRVILLSSGFTLYKSPTSVTELAVPENVKLSVEKGKGTLVITCDKVEHATFYEFQITEVPVNEASKIATYTHTTGYLLIPNLISGKEYAVRVAAGGSVPSRNYSNWVTSFVI
jgi:hypothetical protein